MKIFVSFLFLLIVPWSIQAENNHYSIQLQAVKKPDLLNYQKLSKFGLPYTEKVSVDSTRVKIGSFKNRLDAEKALKQIRNKGFSDAFITSFTGKIKKVAVISKKKKPSKIVVKKSNKETKTYPPKKTISWSSLTKEQKNDVVYVDEVLHLQRDGEFIPLTGY